MIADLYEGYIQRKKIQIVMSVFGLMFLSLIMSCQELSYLVSGKTAEVGMTTRVGRVRVDDMHYVEKRVVGYVYTDSAGMHQRYVNVPMDWAGVGSSVVKIQYLPGRDISRIYGETNKGWVMVFLGSLVLAVLGGIWLARGE